MKLDDPLGIRRAAVLALALVALSAPAGLAGAAQAAPQPQKAPDFKPALIEQPMPDFTLPAYQGGTVTLSRLKGKNVMIVFPRGWAAENHWCTICNYKYVELAQLEKALDFRRKYDVEVLVIFPYDGETVKAWVEALPAQLESINAAKHPADPSKLDEAGKRRMERSRLFYPKDLSLEKGEVLAPFPVLIDADRTVSGALGLFRTEWSGSKVDQNIPSVFIVDKDGVLQFKYIGQNTLDRPSVDYLFKVLDVLNGAR